LFVSVPPSKPPSSPNRLQPWVGSLVFETAINMNERAAASFRVE
jgi:hypothetical protein